MTLDVSFGVCVCKYDTLLLAIFEWICRKRVYFVGPLFCDFYAIDGTNTVFDLLQRKCHSSSHIRFICAFHASILIITAKEEWKKKKTHAQNPNALATCCAIEWVFCVVCEQIACGQIQVIFNTSSSANWNLFRVAVFLSGKLSNDY